MAEKKIKQKKSAKKNQQNKIGIFYRAVSLFFLFISILLVLFVLYFSLSKAKMTIEAKIQPINANLTLAVVSDAQKLSAENVLVYFYERNLEKTFNYLVNTFKVVNKHVEGEVILINNSNRSQTLIATTRLLNADGVLLRLSRQVQIPAQGKIKAAAYLDQTSKAIEINPSKFIIPGLNANLQKLIYAQTESPFTLSTEEIKIIEQNDLENAEKSAPEQIKQLVIDNFKNSAQQLLDYEEFVRINKGTWSLLPDLMSVEILDKKTNAQIGQEKDEITLQIKAKVNAILINEDNLKKLAEYNFKKQISAGYQINKMNLDNLKIILTNADWQNKTAEINLLLNGEKTINLEHQILQKENFIGLNEEQLRQYFTQYADEIKTVKIDFSPFWVKTMPLIKSRIEIKLTQP